MSRTDKDKPMWVRYTEHNPRPIHDHRFGPCDLPSHPTRGDEGTHCQWQAPHVLPGGTCCAGCNSRCCRREWQLMVKVANRRERYAGRREARRAADDVRGTAQESIFL
jgi:hypothetical protein